MILKRKKEKKSSQKTPTGKNLKPFGLSCALYSCILRVLRLRAISFFGSFPLFSCCFPPFPLFGFQKFKDRKSVLVKSNTSNDDKALTAAVDLGAEIDSRMV